MPGGWGGWWRSPVPAGFSRFWLGLAPIWPAGGAPRCLADLDTLEPALAQRLDVELTPNVVTALEALRFRSDLTREFAYHAGGFAVLGGLPNPREWATLAEDEIVDLLEQLTLAFEVVLVRIDRHLEDLSTLTGAAGRFGASRAVAATADAIVGVGDPSPVGVAGMLGLVGRPGHGHLGTGASRAQPDPTGSVPAPRGDGGASPLLHPGIGDAAPR